MIPTILFIGALLALSAMWLIATMPEGYEDADGFHYGKPTTSQQEATEAPVTGGAGSPQQAGTATLSDRDD